MAVRLRSPVSQLGSETAIEKKVSNYFLPVFS